MPYEIVCDGQTVDLGKTQYLLSPQDLAAYDLIPRLIELGVASLKIEGRLKSPEYVANITRHYRQAIDAAWAGRAGRVHARATSRRCSSRSRAGSATASSTATTTRCWSAAITPRSGGSSWATWSRWPVAGSGSSCAATVKPGDGVVFDGDEAAGVPEQGGRVYEVLPGSRRAGVELRLRPRRDRPGAAPAGPGRLEDRRSRAHGPPPPVVRRPAEPARRSGPRGQAAVGDAARVEASTATGHRASVRDRARWRRRDLSRPTRPSCATSSAGWAARSTGSAT